MHAYRGIHTRSHTGRSTYIHTASQPDIHTYTHMHTYIHTETQPATHPPCYTYIHTYINTEYLINTQGVQVTPKSRPPPSTGAAGRPPCEERTPRYGAIYPPQRCSKHSVLRTHLQRTLEPLTLHRVCYFFVRGHLRTAHFLRSGALLANT